MASNGDGAAKRTKVVRLRDPYAAAAENVQLPDVSKNEGSDPYKALQVIGEIKERGFSSSRDSKRVSLPEVTVLPFPVARHRSEGPHWTPLPVHSEDKATEEEEEDSDLAAAVAAAAVPLIRKKKPELQFSKYKELLSQQKGPKKSEHPPVAASDEAAIKSRMLQAAEKSSLVHAAETSRVVQAAETSRLVQAAGADCTGVSAEDRRADDELRIVSASDQSTKRDDSIPPATSGYHMKMEHSSGKMASMVPKTSERQAIDEENRQRIASMSPTEITEAQQELLGRLSPEMLAMLRKRGAQQEAKKLVEPVESIEVAEPMQVAEPMKVDEARPADKKGGPPSWSDRVEAVKMMKFDFDGKILHETENVSLADFGSVAKRDYLRSEGDPAAHGYTIKEAVELSRSTISSQRAFALQLITSVLYNAASGLLSSESRREADWQAVWAYALGPHPQLGLALRMALDGTYATVLIMCSQAIQALLTCSQNDRYFYLRETLWPGEPLVYTAPVFRKQVNQEEGFSGGGSWEYNVEPQELLSIIDEKDVDSTSTISEDAAVAERDAAFGLLRAGVLPRIRYILEVEKHTSADESLLTTLVAFGRHSPTSASTVMECPRLIDTIIQRFLLEESSTTSRTKAMQLLKVLSQGSKSNCVYLTNSGALQIALGDLFKWSFQSPKAGSDIFKASIVAEAVRLWSVCIRHEVGLVLSSDVYAALCNWLSPPSLNQVLNGSVTAEAYVLAQESFIAMELLARKLPLLGQQSQQCVSQQNWSWSVAVPLVQISLDWLQSWTLSGVTKELKNTSGKPSQVQHGSYTGTLAAILHFLSTVCERVYEEEAVGSVWLPEFVPQVGLSLVRSRLLYFSGEANSDLQRTSSLVSLLFNLEESTISELLLPLVSCILGTIRLASTLDKLISWAGGRGGVTGTQDAEERILHQGLLKSAEEELRALSSFAREQVASNSHTLRVAEFKDRGGPAPGVGLGWGAVGGGFWSPKVLMVETYARIVLGLESTFPAPDLAERLEEIAGVLLAIPTVSVDLSMVRQVLEEVLLSEPRWTHIVQSALRTLQDRRSSDRTSTSVADADSMRLSLIQHYSRVWLSKKSKESSREKEQPEGGALQTIDELGDGGETEEEDAEVIGELAGTRLPMPSHWFLSPLHHASEDDAEVKTVIQAGLLLLLYLEGLKDAGPGFAAVRTSRKVHALSMVFVAGDLFLEKDISHLVEELQDLYASQLEEQGPALDFQADVNGNYSLFADKLAVHFASTSYGDLNFGRQVAFYFRQEVPLSLRQTVWRVLAEAKALELLPKLEECPGFPKAYLYPAEKEVEALEMYLGSWTSGGLDRAFSRKSLPFQMAVHHLAEFLFKKDVEDLLRKKFARNIIRTSKRNQQAKEMLKTLVHYFPELADRNMAVLVEACEQDSALLSSLRLVN